MFYIWFLSNLIAKMFCSMRLRLSYERTMCERNVIISSTVSLEDTCILFHTTTLQLQPSYVWKKDCGFDIGALSVICSYEHRKTLLKPITTGCWWERRAAYLLLVGFRQTYISLHTFGCLCQWLEERGRETLLDVVLGGSERKWIGLHNIITLCIVFYVLRFAHSN